MQMKHLLVALIVLLALVGTASAASSVEIRSTILHFDTITGGTPATIDATDWAGFYYDLDNNVSTEEMGIAESSTKAGTLNFTYTTTPTFQEYAYDGWFDNSTATTHFGYAVLGFFAEPYVALGKAGVYNSSPVLNIQAQKIAKLVIDDDTKYILKTGANLELGSGYSIVVDQIDVDGNKAYLKLFKDGKELNSSIINTNTAPTLTSSTWIFNITVLGEKDMQVMRVHVKDVFQGTESSLVEIDGLWMVDYQNAKEIKADDKYGKFECDVAGPAYLEFSANNVTVSADTSLELGANIFMKTEKNFAAAPNDKFYLYKVYTEPGTYDIRSSVWDYTTDETFDYENFAAFFYDMDTSTDTENMSYKYTSGKVLEGDLKYNTTPQPIDYAYDWQFYDSSIPGFVAEQFYIMGLFGEKYVPFNVVDVNGHFDSLKAEKMSKLVIDDDTKYILKTGATLELGEGYSLIVDQIDVDGNKAYIKFMKDGTEVNSSIVNTNTSGDWILRSTVLNEKNTQIARIHVKDVFQGTQDSLVEIDGLWAMDYKNATELKSGDKYGVLDFDGFTGTTLEFSSNKDITMTQDMDMQIANNMYLKTADSTSFTNAYFYVAAVVDGNGPSQPDVPDVPDVPDTPKPDVPDTTPDVEQTFWQKYMWHIIIAIVLIIIIAGAAYYFLVMKKQ